MLTMSGGRPLPPDILHLVSFPSLLVPSGVTMVSLSEFGAIFAMQGFNGLSVFCVLLLMALGLAIIFGQMGVINMAHGEFLTIGAYITYLLSQLTTHYAPGLQPYYFFGAIVLSFLVAY